MICNFSGQLFSAKAFIYGDNNNTKDIHITTIFNLQMNVIEQYGTDFLLTHSLHAA